MAQHALKKPMAGLQAETPTAPQWPSFTGTSQIVGVSPSARVIVFVDPTLGDVCLAHGFSVPWQGIYIDYWGRRTQGGLCISRKKQKRKDVSSWGLRATGRGSTRAAEGAEGSNLFH